LISSSNFRRRSYSQFGIVVRLPFSIGVFCATFEKELFARRTTPTKAPDRFDWIEEPRGMWAVWGGSHGIVIMPSRHRERLVTLLMTDILRCNFAVNGPMASVLLSGAPELEPRFQKLNGIPSGFLSILEGYTPHPFLLVPPLGTPYPGGRLPDLADRQTEKLFASFFGTANKGHWLALSYLEDTTDATRHLRWNLGGVGAYAA